MMCTMHLQLFFPFSPLVQVCVRVWEKCLLQGNIDRIIEFI